MNKRLITTAVALAVIAIQAIATEGINLIGVGPIQQGTAGAGVASAKDSTWLILNPAGLTDVERGIDNSLQLFAPVRTINSDPFSGGAVGTQEDDSMFIIPSISASFGCCHGENGFIGLGLYGTSGMGVDYDVGRIGADLGPVDGFPDTPQTAVDQMTELSIAKMTATYAYKFGDSGLSIGAGPIFVLSRFRTDMLDGTFTPASGDWDTAHGVGAIIGVNQRIGVLSIGGSYMSEQFMSEFSDYGDTLLVDSLNLPQQVTVGAALNVLDNVEVVVDYRWTRWSSLNTFGDQFGWDDQNIVKAGITWGVSDALTLRGGISHGHSPIDKSNAFSNALFPAIVETHLACGASYAWENWSAHFAYVHALENDVTAGTDINTGPFGTGTKISMYQNSLTAGVTYNF
jgi:long-chain fatty acid transport protein